MKNLITAFLASFMLCGAARECYNVSKRIQAERDYRNFTVSRVRENEKTSNLSRISSQRVFGLQFKNY